MNKEKCKELLKCKTIDKTKWLRGLVELVRKEKLSVIDLMNNEIN